MVHIYGQESPGWKSLYRFVTNTMFFLIISRHLNLFGKLYWSVNSERKGGGLLEIFKHSLSF